MIEKLEQNFPVQFYLEDFPATDLLFQLNYKNGMYNVGPVKDKGDVFVEQNFAESYRVNHVGFAIDTDNYLTNEFGELVLNTHCKINDITIPNSLFSEFEKTKNSDIID